MAHPQPPHHTRPVRSRVRLMLLATAATAITATACSSSGASTTHGSAATPLHATSGASPTVSPRSPADQARAQALAAYRAMWSDMVAATATGNYQDPRLAQHTTGQAFSILYTGVFRNNQQGLVGKGQPVLHPRVSAISPVTAPTRVTVMDCTDDTNWLNYRRNGKIEDNVPGGRHRTEALVVRSGNIWKVSQLVVQAAGTC